MIKPPFNYTGNKNRLMTEFSTKYFPKEKNITFLDMFGGGATISINVDYESIIYNDINIWVTKLIKVFKRIGTTEVVDYFKYLVDKWGFTSTHFYGNFMYKRTGNNGLKLLNEEQFKKFRLKINEDIKSNMNTNEHWLNILFLSFYSFNNDIRFNSSGLINIPIGKTDLNSNNFEKTISFIDAIKRKKIAVKNKSFEKLKLENIDFIYADPPYFETNAIYNKGWSMIEERKLQETLVEFSKSNKTFVLSNMSWRKGKENKQLIEWANKNNFKVIDINYSYKASSYNRERTMKDQEVIITNA